MFEQTIRLLEHGGVWVSSVATMAAVFVALWLARRGDQVRLKLTVGHYIVLTRGKDARPEHVMFAITNVGRRSTTLQMLGWQSGLFRRGPWRKRQAIQLADGHPSNPPMPVELHDGKLVQYLIDAPALYSSFPEHFIPNWVYRQTLRGVVHTTSGGTFYAKPSKNFFEEMDKATAARDKLAREKTTPPQQRAADQRH